MISIIGNGAWATTVGHLFAQNGHDTTLICRRQDAVDAINTAHENTDYLPTIPLHPRLYASLNPDLTKTNLLVYALPSAQYMTLSPLLDTLTPNIPILIISKGLTNDTDLFISNYIQRQVKNPIAILSGPNLATEIMASKPAASAVSATTPDLARQIQQLLVSSTFRVYTSPHFKSIEFGGIYKNVIAIAAGIANGLELGNNAKAALITRGLHEMIQVGQSLGTTADGLYGLAGLGDLIATCQSPNSRNWQHGFSIATKGAHEPTKTVEGVRTCQKLYAYTTTHNINAPLLEEIHSVLTTNASTADAIKSLMNRPLKAE